MRRRHAMIALVLCLASVCTVYHSSFSACEATVPKSVMRDNSDDHLRRDIVKAAKRLNKALQAAVDAGIPVALGIDGHTVIVGTGEPL